MGKMLVFLPWCPMDREYAIDGMRLFPYSPGTQVKDVEPAEEETIGKVLNVYRDLRGRPLKRVGLIQYRDKHLLQELDETELEEVFQFVEMVCFAALAKRELPYRDTSIHFAYCNRDHFTCYAQRFSKIPPDTIAVEVPRWRGAGSCSSSWSLEKMRFSVPEHVSLADKITLDEPLLKGLLDFMNSAPPEQEQWLSAIQCFNWANTDRPLLPWAVEWVLLAGAFQLILGAGSKADDVAQKFTKAFYPPEEILACRSTRSSEEFNKSKNLPLRQEWMREFYRLRGNLAHGWLKPHPRQPAAWSAGEHLTLARLAFPLLVKVLLSRALKKFPS